MFTHSWLMSFVKAMFKKDITPQPVQYTQNIERQQANPLSTLQIRAYAGQNGDTSRLVDRLLRERPGFKKINQTRQPAG